MQAGRVWRDSKQALKEIDFGLDVFFQQNLIDIIIQEPEHNEKNTG